MMLDLILRGDRLNGTSRRLGADFCRVDVPRVNGNGMLETVNESLHTPDPNVDVVCACNGRDRPGVDTPENRADSNG